MSRVLDEAALAALEERVLAAAAAVDPGFETLRIDPADADTARFCARYGFTAEESANCILAVAKSGERRHAAALVQASRRLDLNRHARLLVGARKASFAPEEDTVAVTGMLPGGVTPLALPEGLALFLDAGVLGQPRVVIGGGSRGLKIVLAPAGLAGLRGAVVVPELARTPPEPSGAPVTS